MSVQDDHARIIGKIEQFQSSAEREFQKIDTRFDRVEDRLTGLEGFKIKVIGGVTAIVAVIQALAWFITRG